MLGSNTGTHSLLREPPASILSYTLHCTSQNLQKGIIGTSWLSTLTNLKSHASWFAWSTNINAEIMIHTKRLCTSDDVGFPMLSANPKGDDKYVLLATYETVKVSLLGMGASQRFQGIDCCLHVSCVSCIMHMFLQQVHDFPSAPVSTSIYPLAASSIRRSTFVSSSQQRAVLPSSVTRWPPVACVEEETIGGAHL